MFFFLREKVVDIPTWKKLLFSAWKSEPLREKIIKSAREKPILCVKISSKLHTWKIKKCTWKKDNFPSVKSTESWKTVREKNLLWNYLGFPIRNTIAFWWWIVSNEHINSVRVQTYSVINGKFLRSWMDSYPFSTLRALEPVLQNLNDPSDR